MEMGGGTQDCKASCYQLVSHDNGDDEDDHDHEDGRDDDGDGRGDPGLQGLLLKIGQS